MSLDPLTLRDMAARMEPTAPASTRWARLRLILGCAIVAVLLTTLVQFVLYALREHPLAFLAGFGGAVIGGLR